MRGKRKLRLWIGNAVVLAGLPVVTLAGAGGMALDQAPAGAAATCVPAGTTGLTAVKVVTASTSTLSGTTISATGCDVGIYVAPTTSGVTIKGVTVTGANDHGIFVQDASSITIETSTVKNNGVAPTKGISENKAIELVGTSTSTVKGNTVTGNVADGGIGIADDGPTVDPGAPKPSATVPHASKTDIVSTNTVTGNYGGCGIVFASYVPGAGVSDLTAIGNTIIGAPGQFGPHGPVIGQIVVATDAPSTTVSGVDITSNVVTGSFLSGITVHANAPMDSITGTTIKGNTLSANNWGDVNGAPRTDAIALEINPIPPPVTPVLSSTEVLDNTIKGQYVGIWQGPRVTGTTVSGNSFSGPPGARLFYQVPPPGSGYWQVGRDGGVFSFGRSPFYGSLPALGIHPAAPIVGMAVTRDQGGYYLVGADGGVFSFGDAKFFGSVPASHSTLSAPIVGMAMAPVVFGPPGTPGTNGLGYWLVGSDGNVYPFGQVKSFGSLAGRHLNAPVVGMVPTPDGLGYWLVAADGGVFTFGDAAFYGSLPGIGVHVSDIVGIAPTPDGHGYWLVGKDGGVFGFGDAAFYGSLPGIGVHVSDIVGIAPTPDGHGYWLMGADGGVFSFGDARFYGSMGGTHLNAPVAGGAAVGVTVTG